MEDIEKDKRIDLTQFEGMTEGPWIRHISSYIANGNLLPSNQDANRKLAYAGPDLIAELKRCYGAIDEALKYLRFETTNASEAAVETLESVEE